MSGQWDKYVGPAAEALARSTAHVAPTTHPWEGMSKWAKERNKIHADAVLAAVGPLIAEDTRERMVAAAAAALEREPEALQCRDAFATAINEIEKEARWQIEQMRRDPEEEWGHSVQRLNVVANCLRQIGGLK